MREESAEKLGDNRRVHGYPRGAGMDVRLGSKDSLAIILMEAEANGAKFRAHTVGGQKSPRLSDFTPKLTIFTV